MFEMRHALYLDVRMHKGADYPTRALWTSVALAMEPAATVLKVKDVH